MKSPAKIDDSVLQLEYELTQIAVHELGLQEQRAFEVARAMVRGLRKRHGGMRMGSRGSAIYIPSPSKVERDQSIRRDFDGRNHVEVMRRHGISRAQLYRIVSARK